MLYQLTNGRTVVMTLERFLALTDADDREMLCGHYGDEHNDPFYGSAMYGLEHEKVDAEFMLTPDDVIDIDELPDADRVELASVAGMQAIYDDGDYFSEED